MQISPQNDPISHSNNFSTQSSSSSFSDSDEGFSQQLTRPTTHINNASTLVSGLLPGIQGSKGGSGSEAKERATPVPAQSSPLMQLAALMPQAELNRLSAAEVTKRWRETNDPEMKAQLGTRAAQLRESETQTGQPTRIAPNPAANSTPPGQAAGNLGQATTNAQGLWNWDFQGTTPQVALSIDHTGIGTSYTTKQLIGELMNHQVKPHVTVFTMWRSGESSIMSPVQREQMKELYQLQRQYPTIHFGVHPDVEIGTNNLYKELFQRTQQPIPFSYHGTDANINNPRTRKAIPQYLLNALESNQLAGRSTQPDTFETSNINNLPVIPYTSNHQEAQNALIRNARLDRPSFVFFHSHQTQGNNGIADFYNSLKDAIRKGQVQTIPFPRPPNWNGNPKPAN